jgi:hypothetical protein
MSGMKEHIAAMAEAIDFSLGEGYARKNPELIGRLMQAECMVMAATIIQDGLYSISLDEEAFDNAH